MKTVKAKNILLKFGNDAKKRIERVTQINLINESGFSNKPKVIRYRDVTLENKNIPAYEMDDGDLTEAQINLIRNAVPQEKMKSVKSSLIHKNPVE